MHNYALGKYISYTPLLTNSRHRNLNKPRWFSKNIQEINLAVKHFRCNLSGWHFTHFKQEIGNSLLQCIHLVLGQPHTGVNHLWEIQIFTDHPSIIEVQIGMIHQISGILRTLTDMKDTEVHLQFKIIHLLHTVKLGRWVVLWHAYTPMLLLSFSRVLSMPICVENIAAIRYMANCLIHIDDGKTVI